MLYYHKWRKISNVSFVIGVIILITGIIDSVSDEEWNVWDYFIMTTGVLTVTVLFTSLIIMRMKKKNLPQQDV